MNTHCVGRAIVRLAEDKAAFKPMAFLLEKFPTITEDDRKKAILKAFKKKDEKVIQLIEQHTPGIVEKNLTQVLKIVAENHDILILKGLLEKYKEKITPDQIGIILAEQATPSFPEESDQLAIIKEILSNYPNLPSESLTPVMNKAATQNAKLFEFYLNKFPQLKPQHLQDILNDAVYVYGKGSTPSWFAERWRQVAELIQDKFPKMQAVNPYSFLHRR